MNCPHCMLSGFKGHVTRDELYGDSYCMMCGWRDVLKGSGAFNSSRGDYIPSGSKRWAVLSSHSKRLVADLNQDYK